MFSQQTYHLGMSKKQSGIQGHPCTITAKCKMSCGTHLCIWLGNSEWLFSKDHVGLDFFFPNEPKLLFIIGVPLSDQSFPMIGCLFGDDLCCCQPAQHGHERYFMIYIFHIREDESSYACYINMVWIGCDERENAKERRWVRILPKGKSVCATIRTWDGAFFMIRWFLY